MRLSDAQALEEKLKRFKSISAQMDAANSELHRIGGIGNAYANFRVGDNTFLVPKEKLYDFLESIYKDLEKERDEL